MNGTSGTTAGRSRLEGKVTITSGASTGLGRAISIAYASEGAHVVSAGLQSNTIVGFKDQTDEGTHKLVQERGWKQFSKMTFAIMRVSGTWWKLLSRNSGDWTCKHAEL